MKAFDVFAGAALSVALASAGLSIAWADGDPFAPAVEGARSKRSASGPVEYQGAMPHKFDAERINTAEIGRKEQKRREVVLQGVGRIAGEEALTDFSDGRARRILAGIGKSETIYLSAHSPNLIQLPFANPRVAKRSDVGIDKKASNGNLYVWFEDVKPGDPSSASMLFIESPDGSLVISLQVIPKNIPGQTIVIEDIAPQSAVAAMDRLKSAPDQITRLQALSEIAATGRAPLGYSAVAGYAPSIARDGYVIDLARKYTNRENDILVYKVTNALDEAREIREEDFGADPSVQAVTVFPTPLVGPKASAEVVVIANKPTQRTETGGVK